MSLENSWFASSRKELGVKDETWNSALEFEKEWLGDWEVYSDDWNVTPWGSITLDLDIGKGIVSIELGGDLLGFFTDGLEKDYACDGYKWKESDNKKLKEILDHGSTL